MPESEHSPATSRDSSEETPIVEKTSVPGPAEQEHAPEPDEIRLYPEDGTRDASAPVTYESTPTTGAGGAGGGPPSSGGGGGDHGDEDFEEEEEMAKMSFLEHLEELRTRIIYSLIAVAVAFFISFAFSQAVFEHMAEPLRQALRELKMQDQLYFTKPTDAFTLFLNLALVASLFLASPVVLYQVWAFIAPGLYRHERKYAVPFIFFCSALFIGGGLFGYFIAFPFALKFLITFGGPHLTPWITATEYMDMFWTVILGLGIVFELPVLMMFLGLLGILTPGFLLRNFRYAVLLIFIVAAVVTPTSDITNLMIFAVPMMVLYLLGVGLVWVVARRRQRRMA